MVQEDMQTHENPEIITANDNTLLDGEVGAEVDDTSAEVLRTVEKLNFLDKILGRIADPSNEIERLHEKRANDNNTEKKAA